MRLRICLGLIALAALALALKIRYLTGAVGDPTLQTIIAIDVGAAIALLVYTLAILSSHHARLKEIIRGLTAYRAGRREYRAPLRGGGPLTELARQLNGVLAGEDEEETSGPVTFRRVVRPADATDPRLRAQILGAVGSPDADVGEPSPGEDVGPVRKLPREPAPRPGSGQLIAPFAGATYDTEVSGPPDLSGDEPVAARADEETLASTVAAAPPQAPAVERPEPAPAAGEADASSVPDEPPRSTPPEAAAARTAGDRVDTTPPTPAGAAEPEADAADATTAAASESGVAFAPALSTPGAVSAESEELARRELFETFVAEKKRLGEPTDDLEFADFEAVLDEEVARIKREQGVEHVRFDVRVAAGKVALQPRLVRPKAHVG